MVPEYEKKKGLDWKALFRVDKIVEKNLKLINA